MPIKELTTLIKPPVEPSELGTDEQWRSVENKLGLSLPADYRDFIFTYGSGLFAQFYIVYNPFAEGDYLRLDSSVNRICTFEKEAKKSFPASVPYRIYPDCPGLLPWGCDENGNYYFWLTEGPADNWKVISDEIRGEKFREYGRCMTDFLVEVLSGKIDALASGYPREENMVFEQWVRKKNN